MINNNMSVQQYACAQQIDACAQSLKPVCVRTRAQVRGNTEQKHATLMEKKLVLMDSMMKASNLHELVFR